MATPDFDIDFTFEERTRQDFASSMRRYVLNDLAGHMKSVYEHKVEPNFEKAKGRKPETAREVHAAMKPEPIFKYYSSVRVNTQEMVWRSVIDGVKREQDDLNRRAQVLSQSTENVSGTLELDPKFDLPRYLSELDIHLVPGSYHEEHAPNDVSQGAIYEHGVDVFAMRLLGGRGEDITQSVSKYIAAKYPDFKPKKILDLGCAYGRSTLPWKDEFPDAEVHGVEAAAPALRYGHARAQSYGVEAHFHQGDAADPPFEDESFDLIYSCMLLHEMPQPQVAQSFKRAHEMLKPGGLMLHYELPPNTETSPYDGFYLDWDSYYNKEPFYRSLRDMDANGVMAQAGFKPEDQIQNLVPSLASYGEEAVVASAKGDGEQIDETVSRLVGGMKWFTFGAWKDGDASHA